MATQGWEAMAYEIDPKAPEYDEKDLPKSAVQIVDLMHVKEVRRDRAEIAPRSRRDRAEVACIL